MIDAAASRRRLARATGATVVLVQLFVTGEATATETSDSSDASEERQWIEPLHPTSKREARPRYARMAGTLLLAGGYLPGAVMGAGSLLAMPFQRFLGSNALVPLVVPLAGPFIYAAVGGRDTVWNVDGTFETRSLVLVSGIAQVAGFALIAFDVDDASRSTHRQKGLVAIAPTPMYGGAGIAMTWSN